MTVPIVMYHAIGAVPSPLFTPIRVFEAQLAAFAEAGYRTISLSALVEGLRGKQALPKDALVLTFDDGFATVYQEAGPRLRAYGFTASVFLVSDHCGRDNRWPSQPNAVPTAPLMTWTQASQLADDGWEVGVHTRTHPPLPLLPIPAVEEELLGCRRVIEAHTGQLAKFVAYPYGAVDVKTANIARRHFDGAVTTDLGVVRSVSDPFLLPRIDAFYLTPRLIRHMRGPAFRQYLHLRQALRTLRRRGRPDWRAAPAQAAAHG